MASLSPGLRNLALTGHVTFSVGWLGAVLAYLVLAITGLRNADPEVVRSAYVSLEVLGWFVVVPLCLVAFGSGLVQSLGTDWGLVRHYWVLVKFFLTIGATTILLMHIPAVSRMSAVAAGTVLGPSDHVPARVQLIIHAAGGAIVLLGITGISIFKPWGRTPWGRRRDGAESPENVTTRPIPWKLLAVIAAAVAVLVVLAKHLAGGIPRH